ncbi:hypothetical protein [Brenneria rubrifaciens]|uniref:hypothetical protein n=1 Tax=Brenneria rubrifaciens TaxID=55213 RepID=UPI001FEC2239|nr:hypothetical protein [Brenneria rubrifaciens]
MSSVLKLALILLAAALLAGIARIMFVSSQQSAVSSQPPAGTDGAGADRRCGIAGRIAAARG